MTACFAILVQRCSLCASTDLPVAIAIEHTLLPSLERRGFHYYPVSELLSATQPLEINIGINIGSLILRCVKKHTAFSYHLEKSGL